MKKLLIPLFAFLVAAIGYNFTTSGCKIYKNHAPIILTNKHDMVISGDSIAGGIHPCIQLFNCKRIRITNCKLMTTTKDTAYGVFMQGCDNIQVDNNYIANVADGVIALDSKHINITQNDFLNMKDSGGGDFIIFSNVNGGGNRITKNHCENLHGSSTPQDGIDIEESNGLSFSPIYIQGNYIRGGGPSKSGSGIYLANLGGSWQLAQDNILVNCGTNGFLIDSGRNIKIINNKVFSKQVVHVSYAGIRAVHALSVNSTTISGNIVSWKDSSNTRRDTLLLGKHQTGYLTNTLAAAIDSTLLPVQMLKTCNHVGF